MVSVVESNRPNIFAQSEDVRQDVEYTVDSEVFKAVVNNDLAHLKLLFSEHKIKPDLYDPDGMTPLQHACYKGNKEITEFLIAKVSNVHRLLRMCFNRVLVIL